MNKRASGVMLGVNILVTSLALGLADGEAFAESPAVKVTISSRSGAIDAAAVQTTLQVIGHAVGSGAVGTLVISPPAVSSSGRSGGKLVACIEPWAAEPASEFVALVQGLRAIRPERGTTYKISRPDDCSGRGSNGGNDVVCTQDAKQCPDGSYVGRVPPTCAFAPCPGLSPLD